AGMCERGALWRVRGGTGGAQKRKSKRRRRQQNLGSRGSRRAQSAWSDFAFYGICLLTSALSPTRRLKRMLTSCFQKIMGQHLIVHGSCQDHAPNAQRRKISCTSRDGTYRSRNCARSARRLFGAL